MKDENKTKAQLINELTDLRQRVAELDAAVAERTRAEEEIQRKTDELALSNSLNSAINRGDSLLEIIQLLSRETKKVFSGSGVTAYLLSEDREYLEMQTLSLPPAKVNQIEKLIGMRIPAVRIQLNAKSLYRKVLQGGIPELVNDPGTIQDLMAEFTESKALKKLVPRIRGILGIESVMIVPLVSEGEAVGLLDVSRREPFTESDLHRLEIISGQVTVIIRRKRAEEALRESEEDLRAVFDSVGDGIALIDTTGKVVRVNKRIVEVGGYPEHEIVGKRIKLFKMFPPRSLAKVLVNFTKLLSGQQVPPFDVEVHTKAGEKLAVELRGSLFRKRGKIAGMVGVMRDITEWVRAEEALRESEEKFRNLAEQSPNMIFINKGGRVVYTNKKCEEMMGYTKEEFYASDFDFLTLIAPDQRDLVMANYRRHSEGEDALPYEYALATREGQRIEAIISSRLIQYEGENAILGIVTDITERVRAEEALRASQEYARNIIDSSLDMIVAVDMERKIVEFNRAAQETFGHRPEEILGRHVDVLYADPQESRQVHEMTIEEGRCVCQVLNRRKNGQVFPSLLSASVLRDAQGEVVGVMGVSRDITRRKQVEEALRQRNRELTLLHRAGQALSSTLDLDRVLVTVLEEVRQLLDVVACSVWLVDAETGELVCQQVTDPRSETVRGWRLAPGEGLAGWTAHHGESLIVPDVRADERHFRGVDRQTGLKLRSILSVPLRVKQAVIGVLQVVDEKVNRFSETDLRLIEPLAGAAAAAIDNARLYEQARQDAETKSVLLREVNHRVKNNLTAIIGLLYAARHRAEVEGQSTFEFVIRDVINQVQGLATVHSMLSASEGAPLLLSELAWQVIHSSLHSLPRDKRVSVEVSPSPVRVSPDQAHDLALVINELATNTIKHVLCERDSAHVNVFIALDGTTVQFEFRDDGPGYSEDVLRLGGQGIGCGLINDIVHKSLRGELSLDSDNGAVAVIRFGAMAANEEADG